MNLLRSSFSKKQTINRSGHMRQPECKLEINTYCAYLML